MTIIYGAGGHGRVVLDVAISGKTKIDFFVDDNPEIREVDLIPVIDRSELRSVENLKFIIGIGENAARMRCFQELLQLGKPISLIHPFSFVSSHSTIGSGTVIMAGVVVNTGAVIRDNVILNTSCSID